MLVFSSLLALIRRDPKILTMTWDQADVFAAITSSAIGGIAGGGAHAIGERIGLNLIVALAAVVPEYLGRKTDQRQPPPPFT
jgi:hypothetical protein